MPVESVYCVKSALHTLPRFALSDFRLRMPKMCTKLPLVYKQQSISNKECHEDEVNDFMRK